MISIAINGFGRIGRNFLRTILLDPKARKQIKVAVINIGPANPEYVAHMFKYDTLMGTFPGSVTLKKNTLIVDDIAITIINELDPSKLNWKKYHVAWVVDASGHFTKRKDALKHIDAGAQYVLITAPASGDDVSIIPGVNQDDFNLKKHRIVSLGSCTTNAFIPMLSVLDAAFGIQEGFMTTIHAYTNTQVLLDVEQDDLRRSRAAALNIIPTSTGVTEMLEKVIPSLAKKITATSIRVPVAKVSLIDLSFVANKSMTVSKINAAFQKASKSGSFKGIVDITMEELVSSDFAGAPYSVIIDGALTGVQGTMGKVFGWYDNEWAYSERLKDFLMMVDKKYIS